MHLLLFLNLNDYWKQTNKKQQKKLTNKKKLFHFIALNQMNKQGKWWIQHHKATLVHKQDP